MSPAEIRLCGKAALPAGRNAGAPAQRQKQKREYPAVSGKTAGAVFRNIFQTEIRRHISISHMQRDKIIKSPGLFQRICLPFRQPGSQFPDIGRKQNMGRFLLRIKIRLGPFSFHLLCILICGSPDVGIPDCKRMVLLHLFFPADRPLKRVSRRNSSARRKLFKRNLRLLRTLCGNRQMGPDLHAGDKQLILYPERSLHTDPAACAALSFHLPDTALQLSRLVRLLSRAFHPPHNHPGPLREARLRLAERFKKTVKKAHLSLLINPSDFAGIHPFIKFFFCKIRNLLPGPGQSLLSGKRIVSRQPENHLPLRRQAAPERFRRLRALQASVNQPYRPLKITTKFSAQNIFRKSHMKISKIFIDIQSISSLFSGRLPSGAKPG